MTLLETAMTKPSCCILLGLALVVLAGGRGAADDAPATLEPISVKGFGSSAHHWRKLRLKRFIEPTPDQPSYAPGQVREIAANILLFQRENGGWPKDYDMTAILTPDQQAAVAATRTQADASYDNSNVHSQVDYLARAYAQEPDPAWRASCERGFDFMIASQYPNGGVPQSYPGAKGFHAHATFNDGVMIGVLNVFADAAQDAPHFRWLDDDRRGRARDAVRRGVDFILKSQIVVDGRPTGWCQQHDEITLAPRPARTFELASICPQETTEVTRFLMRVEPTSRPIQEAIDAAADWLAKTKLTGVRVDKVKSEAERFEFHEADFDVVVSADPQAPPIWARHYEIGTDRPVFAGRDAVKRYALAEIERERRTGTPWYGTWPAKLLDEELPRWRARRAGR
jgi:PelA/Pel-15E family pectate lyase